MVEKFIDRYVKCKGCGFTLHLYCYPYVDKARTQRDLTKCLLCKGKEKSG